MLGSKIGKKIEAKIGLTERVLCRPEFLISKKRKEKDEGKGGGKEKKESPTTNYDNF